VEVAWPLIVAAYAKARLDEQYALTMARVARILRWADYDFANKVPKLWLPNAR
jgi:DNA polymerase-1